VSLKRVSLGEHLIRPADPVTGQPDESAAPIVSEEYEIQAQGPAAAKALLGEMKDFAQASLQQAYNREQKFGVEELSDPNGQPIRLLGTEVEKYKARGYGRKALRLAFQVDGFGGMKRDGVRRAKYIYRDGVRKTVYEEA